MISFTVEELDFLMGLIGDKVGLGYACHPAVSGLQAKLSVLRQVADSLDRHSEQPFPNLKELSDA